MFFKRKFVSIFTAYDRKYCVKYNILSALNKIINSCFRTGKNTLHFSHVGHNNSIFMGFRDGHYLSHLRGPLFISSFPWQDILAYGYKVDHVYRVDEYIFNLEITPQ